MFQNYVKLQDGTEISLIGKFGKLLNMSLRLQHGYTDNWCEFGKHKPTYLSIGPRSVQTCAQRNLGTWTGKSVDLVSKDANWKRCDKQQTRAYDGL